MSNDSRFNEVDLYTSSEVDFARQFSAAVSGMLGFGRLPDLSLSVIAMDSPSLSQPGGDPRDVIEHMIDSIDLKGE